MASSFADQTLSYCLGIDVGVASLGVALIALDSKDRPTHIHDGTVLIQDSSGAETAERRSQASQRRQYRHKRIRLVKTERQLRKLLVLSKDFNQHQGKGHETDRIALRARALQEALSPDDLGRAVMHIAVNRGIRLTRVKESDGSGDKASELSQSVLEVKQAEADMDALGVKTPGALLHARRAEAPGHRRPPVKRRKGNNHGLRFTRSQIQDELEQILHAQAAHHPSLTPEAIARLSKVVFFEKKPDPALSLPSFCPYTDKERKIALAAPLYQEKRIYEEVNCLRILYADGTSEALTLPDRARIVDRLMAGETLKITALKKELGLKGNSVKLNLEGGAGKRADRFAKDGIKGHAIAAALRGTPLESLWPQQSQAEQEALATHLIEEEEVEALAAIFVAEYGVDPPTALEMATKISVPAGWAPMGPTAAAKILEQLRADIIDHTTAMMRAELVDPYRPPEQLQRTLPYYGTLFRDRVRGATLHPADPLEVQFGRIPNMVVHKALNSIRKTVNGYIRRYGPPKRVHVELSRDMQRTEEERKTAQIRNRDNQKANDRRNLKLAELKQRQTRKNRMKLLLAERQGYKCPYSGREISVEALFDGRFDIDHVLPRAKTLDDGVNNLVVALESANKIKGDRSPAEAFGASGFTDPETGKTTDLKTMLDMLRKAQDKGWRKQEWRFRPDAMERFADQDAFRERYLRDNSQIAKLTARYLREVCADVVALNGMICSEMRDRWGLWSVVDKLRAVEDGMDPIDWEAAISAPDPSQRRKPKNRDDHRHHLLDAIVTALTSRSAVQQLQTAAAKGNLKHAAWGLICPMPDHRLQIESFLSEAKVQQRPNRDLNGQLHDASHYRIIGRSAVEAGTDLVLQHAVLSGDSMVFAPLAKLEKLLERQQAVAKEARADFQRGKLSAMVPTEDPLEEMERVVGRFEDAVQRIKALFDAEPKTRTESEAHPKTGDIEYRTKDRGEVERLGAAIMAYRREANVRRVGLISRWAVTAIQGPEAGHLRPVRANPLRANAYLEVGRDVTGAPFWRVVPRLEAKDQSRAKPADAEATVLLRLQQNDTVEITAKDGQRLLTRLLSISDGDLQFLPINDARPAKGSPFLKALRYTSLSSLVAADPILVVRDSTGKVTWRSPRHNW